MHSSFLLCFSGQAGPLGEESEKELESAVEALNEAIEDCFESLQDLPRVTGILTARLYVSGATGKVDCLIWLTDTLIPIPHQDSSWGGTRINNLRGRILFLVRRSLSSAVFPRSTQGGTVGLQVVLSQWVALIHIPILGSFETAFDSIWDAILNRM